jgi:hypothetical protein
MSERVFGMLAHYFGVQANRLRVVLDAQRIVRADITDLLFASGRACDARDA